jgi:hypothetical protein
VYGSIVIVSAAWWAKVGIFLATFIKYHIIVSSGKSIEHVSSGVVCFMKIKKSR